MSLKTKVKNGIGIFLVVLSVCCGSPLFAGLQPEEGMDLSKPRIWTAVTGHQLKAAYEGRDGNKIRLLANGGKIKTILLEKLSEADQRLLEHLTREEKRSGEAGFPDSGRNGKEHPFVGFLAEAKQKRLDGEEGVEYYQNLIDALYEEMKKYEFGYPKDLIKEDGLFNMKYLKSVHGKKKRISERVNLFTGKHLFTPSYGIEPRWEWVDQKINFVIEGDLIRLKQQDTLYAKNKEKMVEFGILINKKKRNAENYKAWYTEDSNDYLYRLEACVNSSDDGRFVIDRMNREEWLHLCAHDTKKGIFYTLKILVDENGKITIRNSEEGSFLFFATVPKNRGSKDVFAYPRNNDRLVFNSVYSIAVALGRYDRNGFLMDLETLWDGVEKRGHYINAKPSGKHDDPLNVFAERNVKDR